MKSTCVTLIAVLLSLLLRPDGLHAWCWIRDTSRTTLGCGPSLYRQNCCSGNLRKWPDSTMAYHIASSTPDGLAASLRTGVNLWNNLEMSRFFFDYQGTSSLASVSLDGTNLISIDPFFATRNNLGGQGILAISTTWSQGTGTSYRATESDIAFNAEEFSWGDGSGGTIDTVAVVAHESGHSAGLSHAGADCQNAGSEGCGANFEEATMYWNYSAGTWGLNNKDSLELDDAAALVHGYPVSTFTVKVANSVGDPLAGVTVDLLDAAAPVDGSDILEGGRVYGDVTNAAVLMGDNAPSASYINQSPFDPTNTAGLTNPIHPTHRGIRIRASINGFSHTVSHTLADGTTTLTVTMPEALGDLVGPLIVITSHAPGAMVQTDTLTLTGTASDAGRGDSGVKAVTVNGIPVENGTADADGTASWEATVPLAPGTNAITVSATDNAPSPNTSRQTLSITYDVVPPTVVQTYPSDGSTGIAVGSAISVLFNEAMAPATLTSATFINAQGISGTVSYDAASRTATFTPRAPLSYLTTYAFTLTTGIRDTAGNALNPPVTWSFTTQADPSSSGSSGGCFIQTAGEE